MSTTIRIGKADKKHLQLLADVEGISERKALSRAIAYYELSLMRRWLEEENFQFTPEILEAFEKARQWLARIAKRRYKELLKKGENQ